VQDYPQMKTWLHKKECECISPEIVNELMMIMDQLDYTATDGLGRG